VSRYAKPASVDEALALLAGDRWRVLAGGTDFYPAQGARPIAENVLDIGGLAELRGTAATAGHWVVGARTTWAEIAAATALPPAFDALRAAAREVGSVQIQTVATVAGNLCNASPAADGAPPLLVLDAEVELASRAGRRTLPLRDFLVGNRRTLLHPDELLTAIRIPKAATVGRSAFFKLGARRYLVISVAMAAVRLERGPDGAVTLAAVAVGACSAAAQRLCGVERALAGCRGAADVERAVGAAPLDELSPIDDVRASAAYRLEAVREIVRRAVLQAMDEAPGARAA
jgi:CO/xanthine dehydrogenase FAD-binding subunit